MTALRILTSNCSLSLIRVDGASGHPLPSEGVHLLHHVSAERKPAGVLRLVPVQLHVVRVDIGYFQRAFRLARLVW